MRNYSEQPLKTINKIHCNKCGKEILVENGIIKEGVFSVDQPWGYFSSRDGQIHSFDLCEECYDKMISDFALPIENTNQKEFL